MDGAAPTCRVEALFAERQRLRPGNDAFQLKLFRDYATNSPMYPALHEYLRRHRPPVLAMWGKGDPIFGPEGARAFAEDVPDAEIHLLDGGHFLLESAGSRVAEVVLDFMDRVTDGDQSST